MARDVFKEQVGTRIMGPADDIIPVTPNDSTDFTEVAIALYITTGGAVSFVSARGESRTVTVGDNTLFPVGVRRVNATGTDATDIHALVVGS